LKLLKRNPVINLTIAVVLVVTMLVPMEAFSVAGNDTPVQNLGGLKPGETVVDPETTWDFKDGFQHSGDTFKTEPVEWMVIAHNHFGDNTTLLLSKELVAKYRFNSSPGADNIWETSDLRSWLRTDFYDHLSTKFKAGIEPVTTITSGQPLSDETIFLLSAGEMGDSNNKDGTNTGFFPDNESRKIEYHGDSTSYWTRSPVPDSNNLLGVSGSHGYFASMLPSGSNFGVRPAVNLCSGLTVSEENGLFHLFVEAPPENGSAPWDQRVYRPGACTDDDRKVDDVENLTLPYEGEIEIDGVLIGYLIYMVEDAEENLVMKMDWQVQGEGLVYEVFVKGGPGGYDYLYDESSTGDTGLHAPEGPHGRPLDISHFCFTVGEPEAAPLGILTVEKLLLDENNEPIVNDSTDFTVEVSDEEGVIYTENLQAGESHSWDLHPDNYLVEETDLDNLAQGYSLEEYRMWVTPPDGDESAKPDHIFTPEETAAIDLKDGYAARIALVNRLEDNTGDIDPEPPEVDPGDNDTEEEEEEEEVDKKEEKDEEKEEETKTKLSPDDPETGPLPRTGASYTGTLILASLLTAAGIFFMKLSTSRK